MKSRNILERDSVKNAFEEEQKKQEKNQFYLFYLVLRYSLLLPPYLQC